MSDTTTNTTSSPAQPGTVQKIEADAKADASAFWLWLQKGTHYAVVLAAVFGLLWMYTITFETGSDKLTKLEARVKVLETSVATDEAAAKAKPVRIHKAAPVTCQ